MVYWYEVAKKRYPDPAEKKETIVETEAELYKRVAKDAAEANIRVSIIPKTRNHEVVSSFANLVTLRTLVDAANENSVIDQIASTVASRAHIEDGYSGNHERLDGLLELINRNLTREVAERE